MSKTSGWTASRSMAADDWASPTKASARTTMASVACNSFRFNVLLLFPTCPCRHVHLRRRLASRLEDPVERRLGGSPEPGKSAGGQDRLELIVAGQGPKAESALRQGIGRADHGRR